MYIRGYEITRRILALIGVLVVIAVGGGLYFGGVIGGGNGGGNGASGGPAPKIAPPATEKPTIETGTGAAGKVSGFKLSVQVSATPEIASGKWAVSIAVQGGKNRSQTLGAERLDPGQPFVVSNNQSGTYTITPSVLNCAKDCGPSATGYTLPPLTVPAKRNAVVTVTPKCVKSPLALGIDCSRSQVLASFR